MTQSRGRKRQRSLRVPVDDVPRSAGEDSAELELVVEAEAPPAPQPAPARPRSIVPPPPPPEPEPELELSIEEPGEARTTDPGILDAPPVDLDTGAEPAGADELEGEPTYVAVEVRPRTSSVEIDPSYAAELGDIPGEPTREIDLSPPPPPPPPPPRAASVPAPAMARPASSPPPAMARPASSPPPAMAQPASSPPPAMARPASSPPPAMARPASSPPPAASSSSPPPPSVQASAGPLAIGPVATPSQPPPTSSPGIIVVGRTIAIGVGAPSYTTVADERASAPPEPPPPRPSQPPPEPPADGATVAAATDAESGDAPELVVELPVDAPDESEPVLSTSRDEFDEELAAEEIEEASSPGVEAPRSLPPKPPAAPPPPPAASPAAAAPPPPPPSAPRAPPKPPERKPAAQPAAAAAPPAEPETAKRARRKWWEELFNDDYLRTVPIPHPRVIARQTDFIESRLGLTQGATVLDVGCGLGLHAIELTRRGYFTVGLDLSLPMLSRAADEARDQGLKINFVQGDMREMSFEGAFDAVVSWGTSFGYFDDDANRAVVERFHRALKPGGLLLLDVVNRDHVLRSQPNNCWFQGDGCVVMEETQVNFISSRLTVKRQVMLDDGRQLDTGYSIRLYALHELGQILHQRGFRVVEVSGIEAMPGVFFGVESPRLLIVAERRPDAAPAAKKPDGADSTGPHDPVAAEPSPPPADAPPSSGAEPQ